MIQRDVGVNRLAFNVVWDPDDGGFGDLRMRYQRGFNLRGTQTVAGDVQHVVHAPGYPVITVLVTPGAVTAKVHIFKGREVGLLKALVVAEQGTRLARPGIGDHQIAFGGPVQRITFVIHQRRLYAEERLSC